MPLTQRTTTTKRTDLPQRQRVLILQGGVALGAYEAGVFRKLYDWISPYVKDDENVFDIVVGASIGAINGAILVSHVTSNQNKGQGPKKSWEGSADKLEDFWRQNSTISIVEWLSPGFILWWQRWHEVVKLYKKWLDGMLKQQYMQSAAVASTSTTTTVSPWTIFVKTYAKQ
jgi:predicted acylesterase/phospholipase RssA